MNNSFQMSELSFRTISFLRFPMIFGVILIHSYPYMGGVIDQIDGWNINQLEIPITRFVTTLISMTLASISVPLFYLISGYLFFYKTNWNLSVYIGKLQKRMKSLLVPYIFFSVLALIIVAILQLILPSLRSGGMRPISEWSLVDFLNALWDCGNGCPYVGPLWFLKNLILIVCVSPLIYWLLIKLDYVYLLFIAVFWFFRIGYDGIPSVITISGIGVGICFFSFGAYLSIKKKDLVGFFAQYSIIAWIYIPIAIFDTIIKDWKYNLYIHNFGIVFGIIFVICFVGKITQKKRQLIPTILTSSSFFIYCLHNPYYNMSTRLFYRRLSLSDNNVIVDIEILLAYILQAVATTLLLVFVYYVLNKKCPRILSLLSGGR